MKKLIISAICYILSVLSLAIYFIFEIKPLFQMSEMGRLVLLCSTSLFIYLGSLFYSKYKDDNRIMKISLWIYLGLYLLLLVTLTLFDPTWGRNGTFAVNVTSNSTINLIPFKTISIYIGQFDSLYSTRNVLFNLFGNIAAFMPMALFLPLMFTKQNKYRCFILTMILVILGIEITQYLTGSGMCDIDDLILNLSGSMMMYAFLKINVITNLIRNIFLLEDNKIRIKDLIKPILIIFITITFVIVITVYRQNLYENNLEEHIQNLNN